jgi:hypothetical protein
MGDMLLLSTGGTAGTPPSRKTSTLTLAAWPCAARTATGTDVRANRSPSRPKVTTP